MVKRYVVGVSQVSRGTIVSCRALSGGLFFTQNCCTTVVGHLWDARSSVSRLYESRSVAWHLLLRFFSGNIEVLPEYLTFVTIFYSTFCRFNQSLYPGCLPSLYPGCLPSLYPGCIQVCIQDASQENYKMSSGTQNKIFIARQTHASHKT